ncbi:MAG: nucleotidyltransferase domain-containing protein [Microcystis novacekii Mn_MB_F_20050700_S1]|jgi:predicted nucleotidyltransferase|uniref:Nucleotidyltransferase domain-containing protein n=1 Tax=Microcystis novacekii Mn_MB_F_20050700_S1D TaxID=2486266 RepID=A0A552IZB3_9CHRO|nr:MAG: nucleotidyltransferase domain-containing protein [Microcystis novacekii Mn_MB_F_20050700_S1]TRU88762.1 MAG: nucleotidyltransferase domain-containing protein [Microcystis novacekii Mn_MB_F_20050700_S1D]
MSAFPTPELDKILRERDIQREQERQTLLTKTQQWLDENAVEYGINRAYIFGTVTRSYKFHPGSDVDIAVENINPELHFDAISILSSYLGREVDIILLKNCHFAHRIREQGILWTSKN